MEMKKLSVNGQIFEVKDPDAVSYLPEEKTEEEKAQARANIGALSGTATIENGILVVSAASVENNILVMK